MPRRPPLPAVPLGCGGGTSTGDCAASLEVVVQLAGRAGPRAAVRLALPLDDVDGDTEGEDLQAGQTGERRHPGDLVGL